MNPYKAPTANLANKTADNNDINFYKTLLFSLLSIATAYIMGFHIAVVIAEMILDLFSISSHGNLMVVDAIVSFLSLLLVFIGFSLIKRTHRSIVVMSGAIFMFVFWGVESGAFFYGLHPDYPAWYEINMGLNDIVAGVLALCITKRASKAK